MYELCYVRFAMLCCTCGMQQRAMREATTATLPGTNSVPTERVAPGHAQMRKRVSRWIPGSRAVAEATSRWKQKTQRPRRGTEGWSCQRLSCFDCRC